MTDETDHPTGKDTWPKLAIRLRVSRTSIDTWRKMPDAPEVPDYERWKAFVEMNELGRPGNKPNLGREELLKENLVKKNRLLDLEIAVKEKQSIDRNLVNGLLLRLGSLQKTVLFQKLEKEMPAKAAAHGAPVAEMQILGRETADALCELFTQEMDKWGAEG